MWYCVRQLKFQFQSATPFIKLFLHNFVRMHATAILIAAVLVAGLGFTEGFLVPKVLTVRSNDVSLSAVVSVIPSTKGSLSKLPWQPEGYNTWMWKTSSSGPTYKVNYVDYETNDNKNKPNLLLIHGFGASVYHWRYNIPELAKNYHVYAIDLLGFGLSEKPIIDYSAEVWRDQTLAFIQQVVQKNTKNPCVVAGNSLGGFTALYAASESDRLTQGLINGCVLLNAAGSFKDQAPKEVKEPDAEWLAALKASFQRFVIGLSFIYTKQPLRIEQVLRQVYPVNPGNVDAELVSSIQYPAQDPNAPEVFYRVIVKNGNGPPKQVDDLLEVLRMPLLLLWGESDPWIRPAAADKIQALFPAAKRVSVNAGHCPHDEAPEDVNEAIASFMRTL